MNPWYTPDGSDTELRQLYGIIYEGGGGGDPYQRDRYKMLLQQAGLQEGSTPFSSVPIGGGPLDPTGQYLADTIGKLDEKYFAKIKEFNTQNPFVYDEVLEQEINKAGTRLDPYYKQQLDDYTRGINMQKTRSLEDMNRTLSTLNTDIADYSEETKNNLEDALEKSRQGYADVGNYFSGAQAKTTAKVGLEANEGLDKYVSGKEESKSTAQLTNTRNLEDYGLKQNLFERSVGSYDPAGVFKRGADSEAQVRSQAIQEIPAIQAKRQFALNQYAGPPPGADQNQFYLSTYSGLQ